MAMGRSCEQCTDKWRSLRKYEGRPPPFTKAEDGRLRMAILEETGELAPVCNIPWNNIGKRMEGRTPKDCRNRWYHKTLPPLLKYQVADGSLVGADVFARVLVRFAQKAKADVLEDVNWQESNPWWPGCINRAKFRHLLATLPDRLLNAPFAVQAQWLHVALECDRHRKGDRKLLKHARLVENVETMNLSASEDLEDEAVDKGAKPSN